MRSRFMKVFRLFRLKKYGEALGPPLPLTKRQMLLNRSPRKQVILNTVEEKVEEHTYDEKGRQDYSSIIPQAICDNMFEDIVYEYILLHADAIVRSHSFLLMVIHRNRFLKKRAATRIIQTRLRQHMARV